MKVSEGDGVPAGRDPPGRIVHQFARDFDEKGPEKESGRPPDAYGGINLPRGPVR